MMPSAFEVRHVDLSAVQADSPSPGRAAYFVFWWKDLPLGARAFLADELPLGPAQIRQLAAEFVAGQMAARSARLGAPLRATHGGRPKRALTMERARLAGDVASLLEELSSPSEESAEDISVVICTRSRAADLQRCLRSVAAQRRAPGEVIVVDNSADADAKSVVERFAFARHVHEPRPGLSVARNAGIRACRREVIAFTDDDVELHPSWTAEIARAFAGTPVEAVTGLVLPARLQTRAQCSFQLDMGAFGDGYAPLLFERRFFEDTCPDGAHVWKIGAGANMAFRRGAFERAGLFDERLGAGASGCSEDSELWYRLLARNGACLYEPRAVVFHHHRAEWPELKRQMYAYMRGHVAALIVQYDTFGHRGNMTRIFKQLPRYFVKAAIKALIEGTPGRMEILANEVLGWGAGLCYLVRPGWRRRRTGATLLDASLSGAESR